MNENLNDSSASIFINQLIFYRYTERWETESTPRSDSQTNAALYCFKTTASIQKLTTLVQCGFWKRDVVASIISNSLLQFCVFFLYKCFFLLWCFASFYSYSYFVVFFFVLCSFTINITIVSKEETRRRRL